MVRVPLLAVGVLVLAATVGAGAVGPGGADAPVSGSAGGLAPAVAGGDGDVVDGPGAARAGVAGPEATPTPTPAQPGTDRTVIRIEVLANGSARWTLEIRTRLATDEAVADFRAFQRRFRNETERFLGSFRDRMRAVVANAANATGREMRATNFAAGTRVQQVPRRWGVVTYSFTWTNFARRDGEALVVGDVFRGGLFLSTNDTLVVRAPESYRVADAVPDPTDANARRVVWDGRVDFGDGRPRVRMVPAGTATRAGGTGADATATATGGAGPGDTGTDAGSSPWLVALAVVALVVGGGVVYWRRNGDVAAPVGGASDAAEPGAEAPDGSGDTAGGAPATEPVLTDEERVEQLLTSAEGRMRQADVADELDWSASKTSRVLSRMAEEGRVEKLQLGRENVIELPDEE